jgi:hypothetical protein
MPEVILEIAHIDQSLSVVHLPISALLIVSVLSSILYLRFPLFEVPISMSKSIGKLSLVVISISPVVLSLSVRTVLLVTAHVGLSVVETFGSNSVFE